VTRGFTAIGTTRKAFFVDRTAQAGTRYAYQVVAVAASGAASAASNMQVVPDPRPPATFAAAGVPATESMSQLGHDAAARRATLRRLARLRRASRPGSNRWLLLERVERRVRYAGIAEVR
jgi:hypothetical protein